MSSHAGQQAKLLPNQDTAQPPHDPIDSSAFPQTLPVQQHSVFHPILAGASTIDHSFSMRNFRHSDIIQVRHLQLQWFPLKYGDYFYQRLLTEYYKCILVETTVQIPWSKLKPILRAKYQKEKGEYLRNKEGKETNRHAGLMSPSEYFQQQGISFRSLLEQADDLVLEQKQQYTTSTGKDYRIRLIKDKHKETLVQLRIIVGLVVFEVSQSRDYLASSWWYQGLLGHRTSLYINTLGVLMQFRKNGIAKDLLQWLIDSLAKQNTIKFIYLHVIHYNVAAIRLYKKMGFQILEDLPDYYQIGNQQHDAKALGMFVNGGQRRKGWLEWMGSFFK